MFIDTPHCIRMLLNPEHNTLYLKEAAETDRIEIRDTLGNLLLQQSCEKRIDISFLEEGYYLVIILDRLQRPCHSEMMLINRPVMALAAS